MALLDVKGISKHFGGVQALRSVHLSVDRGQIVGLIGPNGAGKTSFFNCITALMPIDEGHILFGDDQAPLNGLAPHQVLERGVARTFQNIRIFRHMTLEENVAVALHARTRSGLWDAFLRTGRFHREEKHIFKKSAELLDFIGMKSHADDIAGALPYGSQKRLEIARALASGPSLLLLDEPVAGMNPSEKEELVSLIRQIRAMGIAVLIIEHDMKVVMPLCEKIVVLDEGEKIAEGRPEEIRANSRVIRAYLGEGAHA